MNCYIFKEEAFEKNVQGICKHPIIDGAETTNLLSKEYNDNYLFLLNKASSKHIRFKSKKPPKDLLELKDYLLKFKQNIFFTVTFKAGFLSGSGSVKKVDKQDIINAAKKLKNQVTKVFGGDKRKANFIPFIQQNADGRYHLHIALEAIKANETLDNLKRYNPFKVRKILFDICKKIDLIYEQKDFQLIDNPFLLMGYISREGVDSFVAEAANLVNYKESLA